MIVYDTRVSSLERVIVWRRSLLFLIPLCTRRLPFDQIVAVDIDHSAGADCNRPHNTAGRWPVVPTRGWELALGGLSAYLSAASDLPVFSRGGRYRIFLLTRQRDRYFVFRHIRRESAVSVAEMLAARTQARLT
jgi:hypothetical protein